LKMAARPQKIAQLIETIRMTMASMFAGLAFIFNLFMPCKQRQNLAMREAFQLPIHGR